MKEICSKRFPEKVLHVVFHAGDFSDGRTDIISPENYLQCSALKLQEGQTFRPHRHIRKDRHFPSMIAQESWVVVSGSVVAFFYDIDGSFLTSALLTVGDASFTLDGGHTYEILSGNTLVYEFKNGPYEGREFDKEFIDE